LNLKPAFQAESPAWSDALGPITRWDTGDEARQPGIGLGAFLCVGKIVNQRFGQNSSAGHLTIGPGVADTNVRSFCGRVAISSQNDATGQVDLDRLCVSCLTRKHPGYEGEHSNWHDATVDMMEHM
jgi:hypothetical protein